MPYRYVLSVVGGVVQADENDVVMQADPGRDAEAAAEVVGTEGDRPGHVLRGDRVHIVLIDKAGRAEDLLVVGLDFLRGGGEGVVPAEA